MCVLKTLLALCFSVAATTAAALEQPSLDLIFAECVGRFSAEREHAWLVGAPDAETLEEERAVFLSLLEASLPQDQARLALSHRIDVKMAHASLLTLATFGSDVRRAKRAEQLARQHVAMCRQLLLGG